MNHRDKSELQGGNLAAVAHSSPIMTITGMMMMMTWAPVTLRVRSISTICIERVCSDS